MLVVNGITLDRSSVVLLATASIHVAAASIVVHVTASSIHETTAGVDVHGAIASIHVTTFSVVVHGAIAIIREAAVSRNVGCSVLTALHPGATVFDLFSAVLS
jgi:hypothetical protein